MKTLVHWTLALVAIATVVNWNGVVNAQMFPGGTEEDATLTIHPDGSCTYVSKTMEPRSLAEQQVRMMERFKEMSEAADQGQDTSMTVTNQSATNSAAPTAFTDEELTKKFTDMMNDRQGEMGEDTGQKFNVEVKPDNVLMTSTRSYSSVKEMLRDSRSAWSQTGMSFGNVRFETDTNGLLRITMTPQKGMERFMKTARSSWKLSGMKMAFTLILPGKVVSSDFPEMATNATWLVVDAKDDKTLDALDKLYTTPVVITAESGGLNLEEPLDAKDLWNFNRSGGGVGEDLPITDAGPGFIAEAQGITTTVLHVFPAGKEYFETSSGYPRLKPGAVVTAKLYAPRGRTLLSVADPRVLKAVDNQGRSVVPKSDDDGNMSSVTYSGGSSDDDSMQVQLDLQLPPPDAKSIDEISAEAITVTAGSWKKMTVTNPQENATNALDLSSVLPGAKMFITKLSTENGQYRIQLKLQGGREVRRLDVKMTIPGDDQFSSYSNEGRFHVKDGVATRTLNVQGYGYGDSNASAQTQKSVALIVRCPEALKRQRVKFELKGLDLL